VARHFAAHDDVFGAIEDNDIQFGNLIFYTFDIPAIKDIKRKKFINL
jgi:hypothetical protein